LVVDKYHKIKTVHLRDDKTHKLTSEFRDENVEYLKDNEWVFTEKIDGTNIRVYWDGFNVSFGGRTDKAQIPSELCNRLIELFGGEENAQMFEQHFGEKEVYLFGEGYGRKIQKGGEDYLDHQDFILFDVTIGGSVLNREQVDAISNTFGILSVPVVDCSTIDDAIAFVKTKPQSIVGNKIMEGVVGTTKFPLFNKFGERIVVKIKVRDYE